MKRPHHLAESEAIVNRDGSYEIYPRGLNIVWGDDSRYWTLPAEKAPTNEASATPATLIQVSWLDVSGCVNVDDDTKYRISFSVKLKPDAFGWNGCSVLVMAKLGKKGTYVYKEANLSSSSSATQDYVTIPDRDEVTIEVPKNCPDKKLYFGLYEVWSGKWKGGLQIRKATVKKIG